jgi:hypothetical protein
LRSQRSAGTFAGNQLLPNASLERDRKALIDLINQVIEQKLELFYLSIYILRFFGSFDGLTKFSSFYPQTHIL